MFSPALHLLLVIYVLTVCSAIAFEFPSAFYSDLALYSGVSVTSNCSNGGLYACSSDCPNRNDFPQFNAPLKNLSTTCKAYSKSPPTTAADVTGNGGITFDQTTTACVQHDSAYNSESPYHISLTMWIGAKCYYQTCNIFSIDNGVSMTDFRGTLRLNTKAIHADDEIWHFIALRYNGAVTWFVDGVKQNTSGLSFSTSASYNLTIGPTTNLTSTDYVHVVDVRWYKGALTDREVMNLNNTTPLDIGLRSECRCPATHPALVEHTRPIKYLKCTNGNENILRLGNKIYIPQYMLDNDGSTLWISENGKEANITLSFEKKFQLKSISLEGIKSRPTSLNIILFRNGIETNIIQVGSGERGTHNFEANSITTRSAYEKLVADKVIIQAKFTSSNYFTVSELKLEARCNCYGNDKTCVINNGTYSCVCTMSSHTGNEHCDACKPQYYRLQTEDLTCPNPCACNTTGSKNTVCDQVGGQCNCRENIEGRQCTKCKHNSANFGNTGCEACDCNPHGITSCGDKRICNCKQNVDNSTGKCETCLQNYYDITQSSGCTACNCDSSGTMDIQPNCNNITGQCYCKHNTQDRTCGVCKDQYFGLSADKEMGCDACECNVVGSTSLVCDKATGNCSCVDDKHHADDGNRQCTPRNLKLQPTYGPVVGGTLLTLTGTLLGTKSTVKLSLDGSEQTVVNRNQTFIIFETKTASVGEKGISLYWTNLGGTYQAAEIENGTSFVYKKNPQIILPTMDIRSFASGDIETLVGYILCSVKMTKSSINPDFSSSGGCSLRLQGSNLDSVAYPKMLVHLKDNSEVYSLCVAASDWLKCPTPDLQKYDSNMTYPYGFRMDGHDYYEDASANHETTLIVVPNPIVYTGMSETYRNTFDKVFTIKGERLHDACHDSDVTITLGDKNCTILSRTETSISCDPGEGFPGTARTVKVKVRIGNFERVWGELKINSFWSNTEFIYIAVGAGVFVLLVILLITCICIIRCRKRSSYNRYRDSNSFKELTTGHQKRKPNDYELNPVAVISPLENNKANRTSKMIVDDFCDRLEKNVGNIVKTSLIERSNIDMGKLCTREGRKIRVVSGQYNASTSSPYSGSSLTIKTLVKPYTEEGDLPEWLNNGLQACTRLQDFVNDNVLRMKGIAVDAKNIYIIYPEMSNRTLKDYLLAAKKPLTDEEKLEICIQVAEGMNYLSSLGVVHKDLAARNCWVSRDFEVKISDASFSYDIYPEEYLETNGRYQPVRWMAPESLRQGYYDMKSDVWSYGVLVWEVYANGYLPYFDIAKNEDVRTKVCDQQCRLGNPTHDGSDGIFQLIEECHKDRSDDRPNFFIVQNRLDNILNPVEENQHVYENREFKSADTEDDLEDYVNTQFKLPPPRPPKGRKS